MQASRRPGVAAFFLLLGVPVSLGLGFLCGLLGALAGKSPGPGYGSFVPFIVPLAVYMTCGIVSALTTISRFRRVAATIGHLTPLVALGFMDLDTAVGYLVIVAVVFFVFAVGWIRILFDENSRIYKFTANFGSR